MDTLNLDGVPISSKSHTHPSHSQTSHLLTSSLSLGVPVPRPIHYTDTHIYVLSLDFASSIHNKQVNTHINIRFYLYLSLYRFIINKYDIRESEMTFLSTQVPRHPPPHSLMYTGASVLTTQPGRH
jgi:hypothetical protein